MTEMVVFKLIIRHDSCDGWSKKFKISPFDDVNFTF